MTMGEAMETTPGLDEDRRWTNIDALLNSPSPYAMGFEHGPEVQTWGRGEAMCFGRARDRCFCGAASGN